MPCSMQSMPASISPVSTSWPKQCAVTFAPCSCATRDRLGERLAAGRTASGRRPRGRSSPPPASPSRRRAAPPGRRTTPARQARPRGRSCGCSAWCARCDVPARISRGRSSRSWTQAVSAAEPQSRISSAPASRSSTACCSVASSEIAPSSSRPEVAVGIDQAGDDPAVGSALRPGDRLVGDPFPDDVELARLAVGQDRSRELQRSGHAPDATGRPGHGWRTVAQWWVERPNP